VRDNARRITIDTVLDENREHLVVVSILKGISVPIKPQAQYALSGSSEAHSFDLIVTFVSSFLADGGSSFIFGALKTSKASSVRRK